MLIKDLRNLHAEKLQASKALAEKDVLTEQEQTELDVLLGELEQVGSKIKSLERVLEQEVLQAQSQSKASQVIAANNSNVVSVTSNEKPGTALSNMVRSIAVNRNVRDAAHYAETVLGDQRVAKALGTATSTAGGVLVPTPISSEIAPALRAASVVRKAGAVTIPMPTGSLTIPAIATGATATWIGENSNIGKTEPVFGSVAFTRKKVAGLVPVSNDLLRVPTAGATDIIVNDLINAVANAEDSAFIRGTTGGNNPAGISARLSAGQKVAMTASPTYATVDADLQAAITRVAASGVGMTKCGWLLSVRTWGYLSSLKNGQGVNQYPELGQGLLKGYPVYYTASIPTNLGTGTNETEIYFVDFSNALIAEVGTMIVDVSDGVAYHDGTNVVSGFSMDQSAVRVILEEDFNLRYNLSGAMVTGVTF